MMPLRTGKIWATVTVVGQEMSQTPNVVCKDCGRTFSLVGDTHSEADST